MQINSHLSVIIHDLAKKYGERTALTFQRFGEKKWRSVSWQHFSLRVKEVSNALLNLGVKPQENIGVFSQNCVQYLYTDFGAYGVRAVTVPFYATNSEQQILYVLNDAKVRFLFVGEQEQYDKALRIFHLCPTLERIIVYDDSVNIDTHDSNALYFSDFIKLGKGLPRQSELETRWKEANYTDLCNILYTSGTTGESKGVMLTYGQYHAALPANYEFVDVSENDRAIDFLPFTHIFERGWAYLCLSVGAQLIINTYPQQIQQAMRETHPTCMSSVPRFWEKVYIAVKDRMDNAGALQQRLFHRALHVGHKYNVDCLARGRRPSLALAAEYKIYDRTVLALVRKQLGLDHPNIFPTAGAAVSPEVEEFVHSIGINMVVGYGLTESLATADGFFRTGDAGYINDQGELFLKERIKDLFKTSNGKYIAPQMIESMLLVDKYVDQVAIIADQRKFVAALIVPDFRLLEAYARDNHIEFGSREELCADKRIHDMMTERIDTLQQTLAHYEKIKRFTLLPQGFTMENGELTSTLKLKRAVVYKNYKETIDKMYEE